MGVIMVSPTLLDPRLNGLIFFVALIRRLELPALMAPFIVLSSSIRRGKTECRKVFVKDGACRVDESGERLDATE